MKSFFKFIGVIVSIFAAVVGAFAFWDKFSGKDYYIVDREENEN